MGQPTGDLGLSTDAGSQALVKSLKVTERASGGVLGLRPDRFSSVAGTPVTTARGLGALGPQQYSLLSTLSFRGTRRGHESTHLMGAMAGAQT